MEYPRSAPNTQLKQPFDDVGYPLWSPPPSWPSSWESSPHTTQQNEPKIKIHEDPLAKRIRASNRPESIVTPRTSPELPSQWTLSCEEDRALTNLFQTISQYNPAPTPPDRWPMIPTAPPSNPHTEIQIPLGGGKYVPLLTVVNLASTIRLEQWASNTYGKSYTELPASVIERQLDNFKCSCVRVIQTSNKNMTITTVHFADCAKQWKILIPCQVAHSATGEDLTTEANMLENLAAGLYWEIV